MKISTRITAKNAKTIYKDMFLAVIHDVRRNEVRVMGSVYSTPGEAVQDMVDSFQPGVISKAGYISCRDYAKASTRNNVIWG